MRVGLPYLIAGSLFAIAAASLPANADAEWSGPGYYVVDAIGDFIAGPYSSEADCKAAILANAPQDVDSLDCDYNANGDRGWVGPGYYIALPDYRNLPDGGPYSSEAGCETALSAFPQEDRTKERCFYEASAPPKN